MTRCYKRDTYNCLHFVRDVWLDLKGEDLTGHFAGLLGPAVSRRLSVGTFKAFKRLQAPASPCIVYMLHLQSEPHVGVFIDGRVLQLNPRGPEYFPLSVACRAYAERRYYTT